MGLRAAYVSRNLRGDDIQEEAKAQSIRYVTHGMLMADGLRKNDGNYHLAFSTVKKAHIRGWKSATLYMQLKLAMPSWSAVVYVTRRKELIGTEEIVENNDKGGEFLPSTQVLSYYLAALEYGTSALL